VNSLGERLGRCWTRPVPAPVWTISDGRSPAPRERLDLAGQLAQTAAQVPRLAWRLGQDRPGRSSPPVAAQEERQGRRPRDEYEPEDAQEDHELTL